MVEVFVELGFPLDGAHGDADGVGGFFDGGAVVDQVADFDLFLLVEAAAAAAEVGSEHGGLRGLKVEGGMRNMYV